MTSSLFMPKWFKPGSTINRIDRHTLDANNNEQLAIGWANCDSQNNHERNKVDKPEVEAGNTYIENLICMNLLHETEIKIRPSAHCSSC